MNLEKRLQSAANELNQWAGNSSPPPLRPASETMRPWMAFAAAFAVVLVVVGVPLVVTNLGTGGPSDSSPLAGAGSTSTTECVVASTTTAVDAWAGNIHVIAFLNDENSTGVSPGAHEELLAEVESWDEIASVSYFDKDDAWLEFQQIFEGQDDLLDIDPAILPATIRIELTDIAFQWEVQSRLEQRNPVVREVQTAPTNNDIGGLEEPSFDTSDCIEPGDTTTVITTATTSPPSTMDPRCATAVPTSTGPRGPDLQLPINVSEKVHAILASASDCNSDSLSEIAANDITTSFGAEGGPEEIAGWADGDERFEILVNVLNTTHGVTVMPDGSALYVWPAAFAYDTWDEIPPAAMDELLRIYTQEQLDQISQLGSYGGWRIGITEAGEWIFFVAGD